MVGFQALKKEEDERYLEKPRYWKISQITPGKRSLYQYINKNQSLKFFLLYVLHSIHIL